MPLLGFGKNEKDTLLPNVGVHGPPAGYKKHFLYSEHGVHFDKAKVRGFFGRPHKTAPNTALFFLLNSIISKALLRELHFLPCGCDGGLYGHLPSHSGLAALLPDHDHARQCG